MPLTDKAIKAAKPREKAYRLADGGGLYLEVAPSGKRLWRLKYRFAGKEKRLALGIYPEVGLKDARTAQAAARTQLASKVDPSLVRKAEKVTRHANAANTFEAIAREWFALKSKGWVPGHADKIIARLERDIFPWIGSLPIQDISPPMVLATVRRIEKRNRLETARRALQNCGHIFRYAMRTNRAQVDPTYKLSEALESLPGEQRHFPAITNPQRIGELLRAIDGYNGSLVTRAALQLAPLVFVRPGELRAAEWAEFDLDAADWRLPALRMKSRREHLVPLASQAVEILRELHRLTGSGRFVFPGVRTPQRCMSNNTVNAALRYMGFPQGEMTGHGFRTMASTVLHEQGWGSHLIEHQLAHAERNEVKGAYNRAAYLADRRKMMQAWADYLDGLKHGADVVPIHAGAAHGN